MHTMKAETSFLMLFAYKEINSAFLFKILYKTEWNVYLHTVAKFFRYRDSASKELIGEINYFLQQTSNGFTFHIVWLY